MSGVDLREEAREAVAAAREWLIELAEALALPEAGTA